MGSAAVFGAIYLMLPWNRGLKPHTTINSRNNVLLYPEVRNKKAVQYIFRSHDQLDWTIHRNIELIHGRTPVVILKGPKPLFSNDTDFISIRWSLRHRMVNRVTPSEYHHQQ